MEEQLKTTLELLYDPDELIGILNISAEELLERFTDKFSQELYEEYCGMESLESTDD